MTRALLAGLLASLLMATGAAATAQAQGTAATPPTLGALYRDGQTGRYLLGGSWLYRADPSDLGLAQSWQDEGSSSGWSAVSVPNAWNAGDFSAASMAGSVGWYRRDFTVPAGAFSSYVPRADRLWIVRFESVNYRATVWLNGRLLGDHAGAYLPFELDLGRLRPGVNRLVVRVDDRRGPADLPQGPGGGWWNYGGLLGEVYLRAVQEADIERVQIRTLQTCFTGCPATIAEQAVIRNPSATTETVALSGRYGTLGLDFGRARIAPGASWTASASVVLAHPHLWSLTDPYLYRATLTLSDGQGRRLGGYIDYSGVRTIAVNSGGRLTLNGRLLSLRGVNLHEQDMTDGAALTPSDYAQLFAEVQAVGARIIRAHYPLSPQIEEMADRDGVLLWSEIPVYQTASQYLDQPAWVAGAHAMLEENIFTNQNHPSVALWSIANELDTPATGSEASYIAGAVALAHRLDPTRPVGMAISDWPGIACQAAYAPLDVIGFNDYFGWYDAGGGSTDDRDELSPFLDSLRDCYPKKALFVTEFGFEANRDGPVEQRGTYEFQANSAAFHLNVFDSKPWLSGALYFPLRDFAVNPTWTGGNPLPDPPFLHKGLLDLYGNPKPAFAVVSAMYHAWPQIGPAPHAARRRP